MEDDIMYSKINQKQLEILLYIKDNDYFKKRIQPKWHCKLS